MKLPLCSQHLAELKLSGLSEDTILQSGIYTEKSKNNIKKILNLHTLNGGASKALVIPFGYDNFARLKLDVPRKKGCKYEAPLGSTQHPYFPPNTFEEISSKQNTDDSIFIVEGEKKALKLWQEFEDNEFKNVFVIGITGVYGWKHKGEDRLVIWLDQLHWIEKEVFLCYDNDVHWNNQVAEARKRLAAALKMKGANVKAIDIPITDPTRKYGVDDYIVEFGIKTYLKGLETSKELDTRGILKLEIVSAAQIETVPVEWLWHLFIPRGEITLIDGNPGLGKSQMIADIAARVSKGYAMPPIEIGEKIIDPENVMLLCAEDTLEKTVKPRLQVCHADMRKVFFPRVQGRPLIFPKDIDRFEHECVELEIGLVVIDPIMSFISRDIDTHSDQSTREVLNRLKEFAERTNISIVMLRHLNKRQGDAAIFRGGGSIAFTAASRCNLVVGRHPEEEDVNVLACVKSNLERMPKSISYTIESVDTTHGPIGQIAWLDELKLSADDIVDIEKSSKRTRKMDVCIDAIKEILKEGPVLSTELQAIVCTQSKCSIATFKQARTKCQLIRGKPPGSARGAKWWSKLPGQSFSWEGSKRKT